MQAILEASPAQRAELFARFWSKVDVGEPDDCWEWQGSCPGFGHGQAGGFGTGRQYRAHRIAYAWARGPIPEGMQVHHGCDNPPCCNPAHLWVGTQADNMRDMANKGRANGKGVGGRPKSLSQESIQELQQQYAEGEVPIAQLCQQYGVSRTTLYRYVEEWRKCVKNVNNAEV